MSTEFVSPTTKLTPHEVELWRRVPIKLASAALVSVIGPASAWAVGGYYGLLIYIGVYICSKLMTAWLASLSPNAAFTAYRSSPILLVLGGLLPMVDSSWNMFVIIVPICLGSYEGAYWTAYHDVARAIKPKGQSEKKRVMRFARLEVFCTAIGALLAAWLAYYDSLSIDPGILGAMFAMFSILIPAKIADKEKAEIGKVIDQRELEGKAKRISNPFAIVQLVATNGMRFAALQRSVLWLGILVAIAEVAGHVISEIRTAWDSVIERLNKLEQVCRDFEYKDEQIRRRSVEINLWNAGYWVTFIGLLAMVLGLYVNEFWFFITGWFFAQGAIRGVLRRLEVLLADDVLSRGTKPEKVEIIEGESKRQKIGVRERYKFTMHALIVVILIIPGIYLGVNNFVYLLLGIGLCASCFGLYDGYTQSWLEPTESN